MRILNKDQFAKTPVGTAFCLFEPTILDEQIYIKSDYSIYNDKPWFNGVIPLCPYFETEEHEDYYSGNPDENYNYYTECFSTDTSLGDFEDSQLFAVFSKEEVRRMIDVLTFALCDCKGMCFTDLDNMICK